LLPSCAALRWCLSSLHLANIGRGSRLRFPATAPVPVDERADRPMSRLREGSYRAARLRRTRLGLQPAMADRRRCEGERPLGAEGLLALSSASIPESKRPDPNSDRGSCPITPHRSTPFHSSPRLHENRLARDPRCGPHRVAILAQPCPTEGGEFVNRGCWVNWTEVDPAGSARSPSPLRAGMHHLFHAEDVSRGKFGSAKLPTTIP